MRWRIQTIEVPLPARNAQGQIEPQSVTVAVSGNVHIYQFNAAVTEPIEDVPLLSSDKRDETANPNGSAPPIVNILFLGEPSFGKDGDDINDILDDEEQCVVGASDPPEEAMREDAGGCPSGAPADTDDAPESRTKLVVITNTVADGGTITLVGDPTNVIGGGSENHQLMGTSGRQSVTIFAILEDAEGNPLTGPRRGLQFHPHAEQRSRIQRPGGQRRDRGRQRSGS